MLSKILKFFKPDPLKSLEVKSVETLSISSNDFLVITCHADVDITMLARFQQRAREFFKTQNVLVVAGDDLRLLKVAIQEKLVDDIILKEEIAKWNN
jgi:hypothetical protein